MTDFDQIAFKGLIGLMYLRQPIWFLRSFCNFNYRSNLFYRGLISFWEPNIHSPSQKKNHFHRLLKDTEAFEDSLFCVQVSEKQVEFRSKFNLHVWAQFLNSSSDFIHYYRQPHSHQPH